MRETLTTTFPKTVNRSQLAQALGYGRPSGGIHWAGFYAYIEDVLGENWEQDLKIQKGQRLFNSVQTAKLIDRLELKIECFL